MTANELAAVLQVDRSTISRALTAMSTEVLELGKARRRRYALRRTVPEGPAGRSRWPLYRIDQHGRCSELGQLTAFHGGFHLETPARWPILGRDNPENEFPDLPFFLADLAPQGFLGRFEARRRAQELGAPPDPRDWSGHDILRWILAFGDDLWGNLVLSEPMLERALRGPSEISNVRSGEREDRYPQLADMAIAGELFGSSAGGEQPKFCIRVIDDDQPVDVIVKFSSPDRGPGAVRWADLLCAEFHALNVLREGGVEAAQARLLDTGGRRFLEVRRFDRVGKHGRRGVITLAALDAGLIDAGFVDWVGSAEALLAAQRCAPSVVDEIRRRWIFGRLIANADMHAGNICFWFDPDGALSLAPAYDMLPMLHRPTSQGEVPARVFEPTPPVPGTLEAWVSASALAVEFWGRVASDTRLSPDFVQIARSAQRAVADMRARFV